MQRKVVLATFGSLGDVHPFIAVAQALQGRGVTPLLAVQTDLAGKCEAAGVETLPFMPGIAEAVGESDEKRIARKLISATELLIRKAVLSSLAKSTALLSRKAADADVIVGSTFALSAPIVAEKHNIPFVAALLQPAGWLSILDPPAMPDFNAFARPPLGPVKTAWNRTAGWLAGLEIRRRYASGINTVRQACDLPLSDRLPLFEAGTEPVLSLGLYSPVLGPIPPDAPQGAQLTGFPWFDSEDGTAPHLDRELSAFLDSGPPPLVITFGTVVPAAAGLLYQRSVSIARELGMRAVLLTGEAMPEISQDIVTRSYVPHSLLFPRAAAVIHHGGIGTTGQVLRAAVPQLVVPFMVDQFDNAERIVRLGTGLSLSPRRYNVQAEGLVKRLIHEPGFAAAAARIGQAMRNENGAAAAANAIIAVIEARVRAAPAVGH